MKSVFFLFLMIEFVNDIKTGNFEHFSNAIFLFNISIDMNTMSSQWFLFCTDSKKKIIIIFCVYYFWLFIFVCLYIGFFPYANRFHIKLNKKNFKICTGTSVVETTIGRTTTIDIVIVDLNFWHYDSAKH